MAAESRNIMASPRSVDICITHRCNLRCSYCSYFSSAGDVDIDLSSEEWLTFFKELGRLGIMRLTLSGGEPFMRSDFRALVNGIISNRMRFSVLSNGTLLTPQIASFLKETKRCDSVQVSIDGVDPESHDVFRGEGTLDRALKGLSSLLEAGVRATVRVTIHKRNFDQLERIAELLLDDIGLPSFSTNAASYMGLCRENKDTVALNAEEQTVVMEQLNELTRRYPRRISAQAGPLANLRLWRKIETAREKGIEELPGCGYLRSCGGVFSKIAVRADGIMVPCDQISHVELGRINRDDLTAVWHNHPELIRLRNRLEIPLGEFEFCRDCEYIPFCRGGCPALAYTITGSEYLPSPASCYRQFLAEGGHLPE